ncbi:hypothetical protein [Bradyrhizobium sp.]|jgi:hypothetical protein|uniref:hypothetical protein n=1 Tax=Bradyrhizobium sp. TaxID=376 RepID=UPI003C20BFD4
MADEAFALSPISARAAQPSEADYDAIQEAFMETSRGRWFLGEYAKRNRNADTKMVLDAVARIEGTLAAQKLPEPEPERDPLLDQMLTSFRDALTEARHAATTAVGDLALEQNLAPVRKGARVVREIAWRLREIGADGRICDLIDSQVLVIENAAGKLNSADLAADLHGAFDRIEEKIASFDADGTAAAHPAVAEETPMAEASSEPADAFDANDEAMLDMIAMEMAAPDTDEAYETNLEELQISDMQVAEAQVLASRDGTVSESVAAYEIEVTFPESGDTDDEPVVATTLPVVTLLQPAPEGEPEPETAKTEAAKTEAAKTEAAKTEAAKTETAKTETAKLEATKPEPELEPSLGSSLLANGIVTRPRASRPDPLAPIRRMSQTEKIAFFS